MHTQEVKYLLLLQLENLIDGDVLHINVIRAKVLLISNDLVKFPNSEIPLSETVTKLLLSIKLLYIEYT